MKQRYIYWQDDGVWLGYWEDYPDYWTQGDSEEALRQNLVDIFKALSSGAVTHVRRVAELDVA